jgi:uncharacterized protein (DUF885 family)
LTRVPYLFNNIVCLKIGELRAFAEKQLGAKFDLREFHDTVLLSGAIPLDVLEEKVKAWVKNTRGIRAA